MKRIKILAVCGFGVGSSMILKMKIEEVAKELQVNAEIFTTDVGSATSTPADLIFTSQELEKTIKQKSKVPVIGIKNFIDKQEIKNKMLEALEELKKEGK
ncbi:MAG: PTS sugar transporter subunit IIB [Tissierellales bacterium]|nr:PTS sugar transporter subunit IIB [Tissierellales bacterium]